MPCTTEAKTDPDTSGGAELPSPDLAIIVELKRPLDGTGIRSTRLRSDATLVTPFSKPMNVNDHSKSTIKTVSF
jgi:hypothetical protein